MNKRGLSSWRCVSLSLMTDMLTDIYIKVTVVHDLWLWVFNFAIGSGRELQTLCVTFACSYIIYGSKLVCISIVKNQTPYCKL